MPFIILFSLWNVEYATPVLPGPGETSSPLAFDTSGNPHILCYRYDGFDDHLILLSKTNGIWEEETVALKVDGSAYMDLTIDKYNRIWTLFKKYDKAESTCYVIVAHKDSSGWKYDTIKSYQAPFSCCDPYFYAFASDNYGFVHLTYDSSTSDLTGCYRIYNGYFWSNSEIVDTISTDYDCSMDIDANGLPYISYEGHAKVTDHNVKCARKNGDIWECAEVDTYLSTSWMITSIRINPKNGFPSLIYQEPYAYENLRYAWYDGKEWHNEMIDIYSGCSQNDALEFDSTGKPYIFYKNYAVDERCYIAYKEKDGWYKELLPSPEPPFIHPYTSTIRIDKNGIFHMSRCVVDTNWDHYRIEHIYGYPSGIGEDKERHFKLDVNMNIVISMLDIHFSIPEGQKVSLKLYNILGEKVMNVFQGFMKKDEYNFHIDLSRIKDGIYFLMLDGEKEGICKKIVIMR